MSTHLKLEQKTGITSSGTTVVQVIGGGAGSVNLNPILLRLEALEAALANLPVPEEIPLLGGVGSTSNAGIAPEPGTALPPTGTGQHLLTENATWGFPLRGLVSVATAGDETSASNLVNVEANLSVQGGLTAADAEFNNVHFLGKLTGDLVETLHAEVDGVTLGDASAINVSSPGLDITYEPNLTGSLLTNLYGYWPLDEANGTRSLRLGSGPDLLEVGGATLSAARNFSDAIISTRTQFFLNHSSNQLNRTPPAIPDRWIACMSSPLISPCSRSPCFP